MGTTNNLYISMSLIVMTVIISTVVIILLMAMIWSNVRKNNKMIKQNKETIENIMMTQNAIFVELQKHQYGQYTQMNQQQYPYQYQQNRGIGNEQVNNNPYMK